MTTDFYVLLRVIGIIKRLIRRALNFFNGEKANCLGV